MLSQSDYTKEYFDGIHPAGYGSSERVRVSNTDDSDDQGEIKKTAHYKLFLQFKEHLAGKSCLDVGCAKGFLVENFREFGVDCHGVDWAEYAVNKSLVPEFLKLSNAYDYLKSLPDGAFDCITAIRFMPCVADGDIAALLKEMRRVSKFQIFVVDDKEYYSQGDFQKLLQYYNIKGFDSWLQLLKTDTSHVESITDKKWDGYR